MAQKKEIVYKVTEKALLLEFLLHKMPDKSRTTVKSFLSHRQVSVNNCVTTRFDAQLDPGSVVAIRRERTHDAFRHPLLRIVYEDEHIIVIDKRHGLLSIGTDKEQQKTAFYILSNYLKRQDPRHRIFVLHRLDRETSGLMMFAKSQEVQERMQRGWKSLVTDRRYVAVTEGAPQDNEGTIVSHLKEDRNHKMWAIRESDGPAAVTYYSVLKAGGDYSLLDLKLETGQKNQIRAHLEWIGTPIAGDKKYNARTNPAGRVCLHAYRLFINHPVTGEQLDFSTRIPSDFEGLIK